MTHAGASDVLNQPPPPGPFDLWADDPGLREAVLRESGASFVARLADYGALAGDTLLRLADDAHRDRPRLRTHDRLRPPHRPRRLQPRLARGDGHRDRARRGRAVVGAAASPARTWRARR